MNEIDKPQAAVLNDDPLMIAWTAFKKTYEFANAKKWAAHMTLRTSADDTTMTIEHVHVEGSLWSAFTAGYKAKPVTAPETEGDA